MRRIGLYCYLRGAAQIGPLYSNLRCHLVAHRFSRRPRRAVAWCHPAAARARLRHGSGLQRGDDPKRNGIWIRISSRNRHVGRRHQCSRNGHRARLHHDGGHSGTTYAVAIGTCSCNRPIPPNGATFAGAKIRSNVLRRLRIIAPPAMNGWGTLPRLSNLVIQTLFPRPCCNPAVAIG